MKLPEMILFDYGQTISNIAYAKRVVTKRINTLIPGNSFEFIIISSNYIFRKPHSRIFGLALEKAGLHAGSVWYAGDNYECDIRGAADAGITPVCYTGADTNTNANMVYNDVFTIKKWDELEGRLKGLAFV